MFPSGDKAEWVHLQKGLPLIKPDDESGIPICKSNLP